jgi:hypothetical protein
VGGFPSSALECVPSSLFHELGMINLKHIGTDCQ